MKKSSSKDSKDGRLGQCDMGAVGTESQIKTGERTSVEVEALLPWREQWGGEEWRRDGSGSEESCVLMTK